MTQFPFWPVFWLLFVSTMFCYRKTEVWEYVERQRIKQFWQENPNLVYGRAFTETLFFFLGPLAVTHALALICRFVVQ
jgi:hypothetical protein